MSKVPNVLIVTSFISRFAKAIIPTTIPEFDLTAFIKFIKSDFKDGLFVKLVGSAIAKKIITEVSNMAPPIEKYNGP